jgi:hypothetical protein
MEQIRKIYDVLKWVVAAAFAIGFVTQPVQAQTQSQSVAYIQSQSVANGGTFPFTSNAAFAAYNFYLLAYNNPNYAAALGPGGVCGASACDTVLLNVASQSPFRCNVNVLLPAQAKADLISFVSNGGKLIIYDSECATQNYNWLPYPFTTANPGAQGASGTATIAEDNALSHSSSGDPKYINAPVLSSGTDAVGDANVMTSFNANWCVDMSSVNVLQYKGPTHTYARYGSGLMIYNGFDVDYLGSGTVPNPAVGAGNLSKLGLQELQVAFNPTPLAVLPCGVSIVGITLAPPTAINDLSSGQNSHTVTATLKDAGGTPQPNVQVGFTVLSGPNSGASGTCSVDPTCFSDSSGNVSFSYNSNGSTGTDTIRACFTNPAGQQICAQEVKKEWIVSGHAICDVDGDGDIDKLDLSLISKSRGQTVQLGDPRDSDGDGVITPADVKACIPLCTRVSCAIQ